MKFSGPNCVKCDSSEWSLLKHYYEGVKNVEILEVDCGQAQQKAICNKYNVNEYPTLLFINDGIADAPYKGNPQCRSILDYIEDRLEKLGKATKNYVVTATPDNFTATISKGTSVVKFGLQGCTHVVVSGFGFLFLL